MSLTEATQPSTDPVGRAPLLRRPRAVIGLLTTLTIIAGWFLLLRPEFLGGSTAYILVSGRSMEPTLEDGDFVIARRQGSYEEGDVAAYSIPEDDLGGGSIVIHRIIGGSAQDGYVLQGDNRETPDLWRPTPDEIAGKMWFYIPGAGKLIPYLRSPLVIALFAGVMAFLFVYNARPDSEKPSGETTTAS